MERLMTLKLDVGHCNATVLMNDFPLLTATPDAPSVCLPVHEYAVTGSNRLALTVRAAGADASADGKEAQALAADAFATVHLLLPRVGQDVAEASARSLGRLEWSALRGEQVGFPVRRQHDVDLPVSFPAWRWSKAPVGESGEELRQLAFAAVSAAAAALARGNPEPFMQLTHLRSEELAQAYQRDPQQLRQQQQTQLLAWHEAGALVWEDLDLAGFRIRQVAGGRLFECLDEDGLPALRTQPDPDGIARSFPLRFAQVAGKIYVLR